MDTGRSRRRPSQPFVVRFQLWVEGLPLLQITLRELKKLTQVLAAMVAAYRLVQRPPDQLYGISLRAPGRQRIQTHSPSARFHVSLDSSAGMAWVVVYGKVQASVAAVDPPKLFEQFQKQLIVFALSCYPEEAARSEVERSGDPLFLVGPRSRQPPLFPFAHPSKPDPRIRLDLGLVLEKGSPVPEHLKDLLESFSLLLWVLLGGRDRTRPPPAELKVVQGTANRLPACHEGSLSEQLQHQHRAAPARAQPTMLRGRAPFHQRLDPLSCRLVQKRSRAALLAIVEGHLPLLAEPAGDRVDGGARTEKDSGDVSRRVAIGSEQHDVHPQPAAGFSLALHQADEVLALLGEEGDTLHLGGCSLWLV